jgi:hypothetical protein
LFLASAVFAGFAARQAIAVADDEAAVRNALNRFNTGASDFEQNLMDVDKFCCPNERDIDRSRLDCMI